MATTKGTATAGYSDWVSREPGIVELRLDPRRGSSDQISLVGVGLEMIRILCVEHWTDCRCNLFVDGGVLHVDSGHLSRQPIEDVLAYCQRVSIP